MIENIAEGFSGELGSSVENEIVWEAIVCEDSANKCFHSLFCGDRFVARFQNYPLRKTMVYHDHDGVISV